MQQWFNHKKTKPNPGCNSSHVPWRPCHKSNTSHFSSEMPHCTNFTTECVQKSKFQTAWKYCRATVVTVRRQHERNSSSSVYLAVSFEAQFVTTNIDSFSRAVIFLQSCWTNQCCKMRFFKSNWKMKSSDSRTKVSRFQHLSSATFSIVLFLDRFVIRRWTDLSLRPLNLPLITSGCSSSWNAAYPLYGCNIHH